MNKTLREKAIKIFFNLFPDRVNGDRKSIDMIEQSLADERDEALDEIDRLVKALEDISIHSQPPFGDADFNKWRNYYHDIAVEALKSHEKWMEK